MISHSAMLLSVIGLSSTWSLATVSHAGDPSQVIAEGLVLPIGIEADPNDQIWVSEMGAPSPTDPPGTPGVGRVSMLAANLDGSYTQVPLVENIQVAFNAMMEPAGAHHISFAPDGSLLLATGGPNVPSAYPYLGSVLRYDPTYTVLSAGPYAVDGAALIGQVPVFPFVRQDAGYPDSNTYSAIQIGTEMWIVDAGANAVIRYDTVSESYSVLAELPNKTNPKGTTPPFSQAVPTRIIADGMGGAYLVELTGFPFIAGNANVFQLAADGTVTTIATGLQTLLDVALASDGSLLVSSGGDFDPDTGLPAMGAGSVMRVRQDGSTTTLIGGLWIPSGLEVIGDDVYVAQMLYGTVTRYSGIAPQSCVGDLNGDGRVDGGDMGILLAAWGLCS